MYKDQYWSVVLTNCYVFWRDYLFFLYFTSQGHFPQSTNKHPAKCKWITNGDWMQQFITLWQQQWTSDSALCLVVVSKVKIFLWPLIAVHLSHCLEVSHGDAWMWTIGLAVVLFFYMWYSHTDTSWQEPISWTKMYLFYGNLLLGILDSVLKGNQF